MNFFRGFSRRAFWSGLTQAVGIAAVMCLVAGFTGSSGPLVLIGVCFGVLTLTFGRRALK